MKAVEGRIHALSHAHTLLSESRWQGADVHRLVSEELAPYSSDARRVAIEGHSVVLSPERAQNIALAVHELATNSAKYGALSSETGVLNVNWSVEGGTLIFRWDEAGGPPVQAPKSKGFGTKIMNASIQHQIGGTVTWDWRPSGLRCVLEIPLMDDSTDTHNTPRPAANLVKLPTGAKKRVLLVEDDAMIGMMMRELLAECDVAVVGPCCTLPEALSATAGEFDCAILDVNLGGESIYPVADALADRQIPIAFVTGYGRESIDARFANVPILQKPITRENVQACVKEMLGLVTVVPGVRSAAGEGAKARRPQT